MIQFNTSRPGDNYQSLNSSEIIKSVKDEIPFAINSGDSFYQRSKQEAIDKPTARETRELFAQTSKAEHFKQFYKTSIEKEFSTLSINVDINTGRIQLVSATVACVENAFERLSELLVNFANRAIQLKPEEIALIKYHPHVAEALQQVLQQSNLCISYRINNDDSVTVTADNDLQCSKYVDIVKNLLVNREISCESVSVERLSSYDFIQVLKNIEKSTRTSVQNVDNGVIRIRGLLEDVQQAELAVENELRKATTIGATKAGVKPINSLLTSSRVDIR